jgi:putative transposase
MIVNHKAVARLMGQNNLQVRPWRKFVRTMDSDHDGPIFPNLARGFRSTGPNQPFSSRSLAAAVAKRSRCGYARPDLERNKKP